MEFPTSPTSELGEFLMTWLENDLQEFFIAGDSTNVFWWAPSFTGKADWLCWRI
jgi:hypothetical protein